MTPSVMIALSMGIYFILLFATIEIIDCRVQKKLDKLIRMQVDPKKPIRLWKHPYDGWVGECPICGRTVRFAQKHCHNCVQLLDWTEVLEMPCEDEDSPEV